MVNRNPTWLLRLTAWMLKRMILQRHRGSRVMIVKQNGIPIFDGDFDKVEWQRLPQGKASFHILANPRLGGGKFMVATPATRPHRIDFTKLRWDEGRKAWVAVL